VGELLKTLWEAAPVLATFIASCACVGVFAQRVLSKYREAYEAGSKEKDRIIESQLQHIDRLEASLTSRERHIEALHLAPRAGGDAGEAAREAAPEAAARAAAGWGADAATEEGQAARPALATPSEDAQIPRKMDGGDGVGEDGAETAIKPDQRGDG